METWEIVLLSIGAVVVAVAVVGAIRAQRVTARPPSAPPSEMPVAPLVDGGAVVVLDVEAAEPDDPAAKRMVREAAARVYRMMPSAERVEVRSRTGAPFGVVRRRPPERRLEYPEPSGPPRAARSRRPDLTPHLSEPEEGEPPTVPPSSPPVFAPGPPPSVRRPLSERFDLPETVIRELGDSADPAALVRAILWASGTTVAVEGDVLRADGYAVVVLIPSGPVVEPESLDHAYLRIERSGAARGLVIGMGILDVADVRRREALAPHVLHAGLDGIQRMADAVALGEDPLRFAAGPALVAGPSP